MHTTITRLEELAAEPKFDALGKLAWLWMSSPLHRDWMMSAATQYLLPAIELGQFQMIERAGMPVAYCSWARLSPQAEMRYMIDPSTLRAEDWNSGDRLWFIDWVAPFAARDSWRLRRVLAERFPNELARAIRVKRDRDTARVMQFKGRAMPATEARDKFSGYYAEFFRALRKQGCPEPI